MVTDVDKGYAALAQTLTAAGSARVLVGIRGSEGSDLLVYAAANEFGVDAEFGIDEEDDSEQAAWRRAHGIVGLIPERSFLRSTVDENHEKYGKLLRKAILSVIRGKATPEQALGLVGVQVVNDVQAKIRSSVAPPNSPRTIARKGSSVTLVDGSRLVQSIDYLVELE